MLKINDSDKELEEELFGSSTGTDTDDSLLDESLEVARQLNEKEWQTQLIMTFESINADNPEKAKMVARDGFLANIGFHNAGISIFSSGEAKLDYEEVLKKYVSLNQSAVIIVGWGNGRHFVSSVYDYTIKDRT